MKRFKFSLQAVHNLRVSERDKAERELASAAAAVVAAQAQVEQAERTRTIAEEVSARALRAAELDPHEAAQRADYLYSLVERKRQAQIRLAVLEQERESRREALVQASRGARTTEQLRERHLAHYHLEAARVEQNALDEMATVAAARRMIKI